jgi:hypothetical protein
MCIYIYDWMINPQGVPTARYGAIYSCFYLPDVPTGHCKWVRIILVKSNYYIECII